MIDGDCDDDGGDYDDDDDDDGGGGDYDGAGGRVSYGL